ncbi:MAG: NusG domain II-containing protein [Lactococcus plantarum]|nr:NusG domain II-containing protein [Lactococcus plantarum]MDN6085478.1 NusG domain II-containing protein [Lactococcus plantarum]
MNSFRNYTKHFNKLKMKPLDFILIISLMIASFFPLLFFVNRHTTGQVAQLRVNNKLIKEFKLSEDQVFTYVDKLDGDRNKIAVRDGQIAIVDANCADQICVRKGFIGKAGQTIVCLPHRLVIEIMTTNKEQNKDKDRIVDY